MSGSKPIYYWDSCIYIAWLKQEEAYAKYLSSIEEVVKANADNKNIIITSVITYIEVLSCGLTASQENKFSRSFRHGNHIRFDVDIKIAKKARELRDYFIQNKIDHDGKHKILGTPDAIHLATAILRETNVFQTFDDGKSDKRNVGLLALAGHPTFGGLSIQKPSPLSGLILFDYIGPKAQEIEKAEEQLELPENLPATVAEKEEGTPKVEATKNSQPVPEQNASAVVEIQSEPKGDGEGEFLTTSGA